MAFHLRKISKRIYIVLACLTILIALNICTNTFPLNVFNDSTISANSMKVLTWNVKCHDENYAHNQKFIAENILSENPDIVFLCEFALSKSEQIDSLLTPTYNRYYISGTNGVFYSKCRIEELREVNHQYQTGKHSLNIIADAIVNNDTLTLVGCHFASSRKDVIGAIANRSQEAKSIASEIDKRKSPIILLGDLNDISGSRTLNILQEVRLKDAWWEKGRGYGSTFHGYGLRLRIDHVMYDAKNLMLSEVTVGETDLSDHNYMTATFSIR